MYQIQTYEVIAGKTSLLVCLKQENNDLVILRHIRYLVCLSITCFGGEFTTWCEHEETHEFALRQLVLVIAFNLKHAGVKY
jgi:hypothetical protein